MKNIKETETFNKKIIKIEVVLSPYSEIYIILYREYRSDISLKFFFQDIKLVVMNNMSVKE